MLREDHQGNSEGNGRLRGKESSSEKHGYKAFDREQQGKHLDPPEGQSLEGM